MSDLIPNTVEEFLKACDSACGVALRLECPACGAVWMLYLPELPDPLPNVRCASHDEDEL
jgi:hypothetical protein